MAPDHFRFDRFTLDLADRRLARDGETVALNARYFDALALLVREHGRLVTKDRFLEEVWRGVPVTDEALTQCVRTLRRALDDEAGRPRFIETAPKHGYRFIAPIEDAAAPARDRPGADWRGVARQGVAGTLGAVAAGAIGGLAYGFAGAARDGAVSALIVLLCITVVIALLGGAGVAFGIAMAETLPGRPAWRAPFGGAIGGLVVGAAFKLVGLDALTLLFGHAPRGITGGGEGLLLGGAVGLGAWLAGRASGGAPRRVALAALCGGLAGLAIPLLGGRLLGGSLDLLAQSFPASRLRIAPLSQALTGALEGALFAAGLVGAMLWARPERRN